MKNNTVIAVIYGLVSVVVGGWLVFRESPGRGGDAAAGGAGVPGQDLRDDPDSAVATEVGPEGIRLIFPSAEGLPPDATTLSSTVPGPDPGERMKALESVVAPRLPESGSALLKLGDPSIQAVADLLTDAGLSGPVLETNLRGVYGHVQRLATFSRMARLDAEAASAQEREDLALDPGNPSRSPSLHWRAEVWNRRSQEYAGYIRRDLETRLGIQDETVVRQLVVLADELLAREGGGVPGDTTPGESPP